MRQTEFSAESNTELVQIKQSLTRLEAAVQEIRAVYLVKRTSPSAHVVIVEPTDDEPHGKSSDGDFRIVRNSRGGGVTILG